MKMSRIFPFLGTIMSNPSMPSNGREKLLRNALSLAVKMLHWLIGSGFWKRFPIMTQNQKSLKPRTMIIFIKLLISTYYSYSTLLSFVRRIHQSRESFPNNLKATTLVFLGLWCERHLSPTWKDCSAGFLLWHRYSAFLT